MSTPANIEEKGSAASIEISPIVTFPVAHVRSSAVTWVRKRSTRQSSLPGMCRPWFTPQSELVLAWIMSGGMLFCIAERTFCSLARGSHTSKSSESRVRVRTKSSQDI